MKQTGRIIFMKRLLTAVLFLSGPFLLHARALEIAYKISMPNPASHYFHVQIDLSDITGDTVDLQMPAWSPGRYLIMNFARNVRNFSAWSDAGPLSFSKADKQTWRIETQGISAASVRYEVYGNNLSGELSLLNDQQGFIDGASIYMYVVGRKDQPVSLEIVPPNNWMILSSAGELGQTDFTFPHYDRMIDELVQLGTFFIERFTIGPTEYRVSILNNGSREHIPAFVDKVRRLQEAAVRMLGPFDSPRYTFFYHFLPDSRDSAGMEHLNCCQLTRKHALDDTGYMMDLTIWVTAHELIHAWNGKRLRPQNIGPFDYSKEVYTKQFWFMEGFTSYLADLILVRSEVWNNSRFYQQFADQITAFRGSPGIFERSPEDASFDIWLWPIDGSRESDWNNTWTSFYISGELIAMNIDLEIRHRTKNQKKFEDFFLLLYSRLYREAEAESYYAPGRGYTTEDILKALEDTTQNPWQLFFSDYIATPGDMPFPLFLGYAALILQEKTDEPPLAYTGLHLTSAPGGFPQGQWLDHHSPAVYAGLSVHDTLIALDGERVLMRNYKEVLRRHSTDDEVKVTFLRDDRLMETTMQLDSEWTIVNYEIVESPDFPPLALQIREDWTRPYEASTSVEWVEY